LSIRRAVARDPKGAREPKSTEIPGRRIIRSLMVTA